MNHILRVARVPPTAGFRSVPSTPALPSAALAVPNEYQQVPLPYTGIHGGISPLHAQGLGRQWSGARSGCRASSGRARL